MRAAEKLNRVIVHVRVRVDHAGDHGAAHRRRREPRVGRPEDLRDRTLVPCRARLVEQRTQAAARKARRRREAGALRDDREDVHELAQGFGVRPRRRADNHPRGSGFEGLTRIYLERITVRLERLRA